MLSGRRAFQGETTAETMTAILKQEPEELTETNAKINPVLDKIVRRCLEKKPERRFQSTSDLAVALTALALIVIGVLALRPAPRPSGDPPTTWLELGPPHQRFALHPSPAIS